MPLRSKRKTNKRKRDSRRRVSIENLEDRRLLATLSFTPVDKTLTDGTLFVNAGEKFSVRATALSDSEISVNNHQLNLSNSTAGLTFDNFSATGSDFSSVTDASFAGDSVVSALVAFGDPTRSDVLVVPPPRLLGTFDVTVPTDAAAGAQFTLTASNVAGAFGTSLRPQTGDAFPITDFGDLSIQVGSAPTGVDLELVPVNDANVKSVDEVADSSAPGGTRTQVTVDAGATFMVTAQIESAPRPVSGYNLNFVASDNNLVLKNYSLTGSDFSVFPTGETGLDTSATPSDPIVAAILPSGATTPIPPIEDLGTFEVTVPTTPGTYRLTANSASASSLTTTSVTDGTGNSQIPISDFGDITIVVEGTAAGVDLELVPVAATNVRVAEVDDATVPGGKRTQVTVDPGATFMVTAQIESAPRPVSGYNLNFVDSDNSLVLKNYSLTGSDFSVFPTGETGLDTSATPSDPIVAAILPSGATTPIPPIEDLGTFEVTVPTAPGTYRLTANSASASTLTTTSVTDGSGNSQIPISDFGDITIVVGNNVSGVDLELVPSAAPNVSIEEVEDPVTSGQMTTQVTVAPGTVFQVTAQIESAPSPVSGYSLNFIDSDSQLVLNNYSITGSDFSVFPTGETGLDTSATPSDPIVAAIIPAGATTPIPPLESLGTFDVTAPTAPGLYRVTVNSQSASALTTTSVTDGSGNAQVPITDFADVLVRVADAQLPTVTVAVNPASVNEDGTENLTYTFTRTGATTDALTVNYTVGGTAQADDFSGTGTSVVIPAGAASATVVVDPTADTTDEVDETVVLTISPNASVYTVGTNNSATGTIIDDDDPVSDLPSVSVAVTPASVLEDGTANLVYTFTRVSGDATPITVNYSTTGTAVEGVDFTGTSNSISIPASGTATVTVDPTTDTQVEPDETVVLTITPDAAYSITTASATGTITNDDVANPSDNVTFVDGVVTVFDGNDIEFFQFGGVGSLFVRVDGVMSGPFANPTKLIAFGNEGNDSIVVVPRSMNIPTEFFGGPGDDIIFGAAGNDMLDGGTGNDQLVGLGGNNTVINESGAASQSVSSGTGTVAPATSRSDVDSAAAPASFSLDTQPGLSTGFPSVAGGSTAQLENNVGDATSPESDSDSADGLESAETQNAVESAANDEVVVGSSSSTNSSRTNPENPLDANNDDVISSADVLVIVNHLIAQQSQHSESLASDQFFSDTNNDGEVTPLDALLVINSLIDSAKYEQAKSVADDGDEHTRQNGVDQAHADSENWLF